MVPSAVVSLLLAALIGGSGVWTMSRGGSGGDVNTAVQRLVAPTQLAAAVMLAAGGIIALAAGGRIGLAALILGGIGALGTIGAGSWRGARYAAQREAASGCGSGSGCAGCEQVCGDSRG
ncbi:MAG: hypothetical protein WCH82_04980 [Mycobacteriaceae bacterium]